VVKFAANLTHHVEKSLLASLRWMIGLRTLFFEMVISSGIVPSLIDLSLIHDSTLNILPFVGRLQAL
jgi:hypothetical protein